MSYANFPVQGAVMGRSPDEDGTINMTMQETGFAVANYHLERVERTNTAKNLYVFMGGVSVIHGAKIARMESEVIADIAIDAGLPSRTVKCVGGGASIRGFAEALRENLLDRSRRVTLFTHGHHRKRSTFITGELFREGVNFVSAGEDD